MGLSFYSYYFLYRYIVPIGTMSAKFQKKPPLPGATEATIYLGIIESISGFIVLFVSHFKSFQYLLFVK